MNSLLIVAMKRLGYREIHKDVWAKPVAYHLYSIRLAKKKHIFTNSFLGVNKKLFVYNKAEITEIDRSWEDCIKFIESQSICNVGSVYASASDFGFLTKEEMFNCLL